jgi:hypothetical protein
MSQLKISNYFQETHARELLNTSFGSSVSTASTSSSLTSHSSNSSSSKDLNLERIKTYLRSTTSQDRLSSLAILSLEKDIPIDIDLVIKKFAQSGNRKMIFVE